MCPLDNHQADATHAHNYQSQTPYQVAEGNANKASRNTIKRASKGGDQLKRANNGSMLGTSN
ncbi:hypothetical protein LPH44_09005 [Xylella taiwanensis]|uniref:hypothetical protein n=1 Tax=Xylella taiwanensis TaxID=1444770 RepID=UPI0012685FF4|nr:hypothetical protein [Xylella taiwanensis]MCD8459573.1 hypothetical protein [Xylella taiwanensis]MCD8466197.1 hypothetical protein [Xylella taiwanensis]UFM94228.1 hypothetical protein LPH39_02780 [Xylella taiwanensis]UFN07276.1 hypothetical protein LPH42_02625 [Xylella taiwanensis]UFN10853.1 hypothetical protein LPH44_09005 [Xylella taiwanensis]